MQHHIAKGTPLGQLMVPVSPCPPSTRQMAVSDNSLLARDASSDPPLTTPLEDSSQ